MEVKLIGYDTKWAFLHMAFVGSNTGLLHAVGVSRFVAKYPSRKTVPPAALFALLGYDVPPSLAVGTSFEQLNSTLEDELRKAAHQHDHQSHPGPRQEHPLHAKER